MVNDARVIPARLLGKKAGSGGKAELLLVRPAAGSPADALEGAAAGVEWFCIGQASKVFKVGNRIEFDAGVRAEVLEALGGGEYRVRLEADGSLDEALARAGRLPLPPYIERAPEAPTPSATRRSTSGAPGSVAAPTAGLHFTPELFRRLAANGVEVRAADPRRGAGHVSPRARGRPVPSTVMHAERAVLPEAAAAAVRAAKREGRRVVAVGTTVVRTLETLRLGQRGGRPRRAADPPLHHPRPPLPGGGRAGDQLPPARVDAADAGGGLRRPRANPRRPTREAVARRYRFFSYGDAMFSEGDA